MILAINILHKFPHASFHNFLNLIQSTSFRQWATHHSSSPFLSFCIFHMYHLGHCVKVRINVTPTPLSYNTFVQLMYLWCKVILVNLSNQERVDFFFSLFFFDLHNTWNLSELFHAQGMLPQYNINGQFLWVGSSWMTNQEETHKQWRGLYWSIVLTLWCHTKN